MFYCLAIAERPNVTAVTVPAKTRNCLCQNQWEKSPDLMHLSIDDLADFFAKARFTDQQEAIASRLLIEINSRLSFMKNVGLGYLTLNRKSNTLSGGESQRINLATSLGSSLVGSMYILDEPSIGLHSRDNERLINILKQLKSLGNTVIVVEHDEDIMCAADAIIDIGPGAGSLGGEVVGQGSFKEITSTTNTYSRLSQW